MDLMTPLTSQQILLHSSAASSLSLSLPLSLCVRLLRNAYFIYTTPHKQNNKKSV